MIKAKQNKTNKAKKPSTEQKVVTIVKAKGEPDEVIVERGTIILKAKPKAPPESKPKPERLVTEPQAKIEESTPKRVQYKPPNISRKGIRLSPKTPKLR